MLRRCLVLSSLQRLFATTPFLSRLLGLSDRVKLPYLGVRVLITMDHLASQSRSDVALAGSITIVFHQASCCIRLNGLEGGSSSNPGEAVYQGDPEEFGGASILW